MSRTQLPSIFPWTEPSKTRREIVKNELPKTRKRKKDEDKVQSSSDSVSSLNESPTQSTSNAVDEIQRLPSETVRSVSSHVESSASNTEDEIQRSHIILEKIKREQTEKEEIQRLLAEQQENERLQMQRELDSLKKEVNKLKYKLEKEPLVQY